MKYVYGKKMKTLKDRLTTGFASLIILANSAGMSLPFLFAQKAAAATGSVVLDKAVHVDKNEPGETYTGVYFGFTVSNVSTAKSLELQLIRESDFQPYAISAQASVLNAVNSNSSNPGGYSTGGTVLVTGSRSSSSWAPQMGTWQGSDRPLGARVVITLLNETKIVSEIKAITDEGINEDGVFAGVLPDPTINFVANYIGNPNYHGISLEINTPDLTDASGVEISVERTNGAPDIWVSNPANTNATSGLNGPSHVTTAPIVIVEGSRTRTTSTSWLTSSEPWTNDQTPQSVTVRVTRDNGPDLVQTVSLIGSPWTTTWPQIAALLPDPTPTDTTKPVMTGYQLSSYHLRADGDNPTLTGTSTDDVGVTSTKYAIFKYVNGKRTSVRSWKELPTANGTSYGDQTVETDTVINLKNLPEGTYEFSVRAWDAAGHKTNGGDLPFYVDNTAPDSPAVSLNSSPSGDIILNGGLTNSYGVVASWTVGPDDAGYEYRYYNSIPGDTYNAPVYYTTQPTVPMQSGVFNRGEGLHHIQVRAVDASGNWSDWSEVFNVTYDATFPTFAIVTPSNGTAVSGVITIEAEITDESDITKVLMNIAGISRSWTNGSSSTITRNGNIFSTTIDTTTLPDGPVWVTLRGTDGAGNTRYWNNNANNRQHVFYVDNTAPTAPTITAPGARTWHKTAPIVNSWTASEDTSGIAEYQVAYRYDDGHTFSNSTCPGETINGLALSGCRNTTGQSRNHTPGNNEQGGVTIWVRAIDNAGNKGPWSKSVHYYYDHEAPVTDINVSEVVDGVFTVSGDASDNLALNRVYVQLVSREANLRCGGTTINLIPEGDTASWSKTYDIRTLMSVAASPVPCPEGEYAAHVSVVDMAGNTSSAGWTDNFTVETLKPAVNGEHLAIAGGHISVGFNFANFKDISDVKVQLFNADGEIATNQGTSLLNDLLNGWGLSGGSVTSPFYLSDAPDDDYWVFDDTEWTEDTKPTYAVVTITGSNGDKSVTIEGLTNAGEDTYESLLAAVLGVQNTNGNTTEEEEEEGFVESAFTNNPSGGRGQGGADSSNGANTNNARGVLGESTGLSNTGSAINMFAAAAAALLGAALWIVRRKSAAN